MGDDPHYKVVMLGDSGVGKTALVNRISEGAFSESHVPTVGSQFIALPLEVNSKRMTLELWDTAGQEVYRSLVGFYTREAKGAFLVCDVTNDQTYQGLPDWIKFVNEQAPGVKIIIFANKVDLDEQRVIPSDKIAEFAKSNGVELVEGSAKLGQNTTDAFEKMGELMLSTNSSSAVPVSIAADDLGKKRGKKEGGCC
jgi:small GTP-binding protein